MSDKSFSLRLLSNLYDNLQGSHSLFVEEYGGGNTNEADTKIQGKIQSALIDAHHVEQEKRRRSRRNRRNKAKTLLFICVVEQVYPSAHRLLGEQVGRQINVQGYEYLRKCALPLSPERVISVAALMVHKGKVC